MFFSRVKNKDALASNGTDEWHRAARNAIIDLFEIGLEAVNPASAISSHVVLNGNTLTISSEEKKIDIDLRDIDRVIVIGGGKATARMAMVLESILGDKITHGLIIVPSSLLEREPFHCTHVKVVGSGHPIPDQAGINGVREMIEIARGCTMRDLVFCLISGGGSALMPQPAGSITLEDLQVTNRVLLDCGASIDEINTIRKHISRIKGGWLATYLSRARVVTLIISDVVGDNLSTIASGLTVPDPTTFSDAMAIIERRGMKTKLPQTVNEYLEQGIAGKVPETPKP
nr:glycerate-2-kinase family protein [Candidatus Sigynarchaeota archaeon]